MQLRSSIVSIDATLGAIDNRLAREFPGYANLAAPKPLSIDDVQAHLKSDEALVLFLDIPRIGKLTEESLAWAVTKTDARWVRVDLGTAALRDQVQALRCGLSVDAWSSGRCHELLKADHTEADRDAGRLLPFDHKRGHALYRALFDQIEDLVAGKHLLVVPSGSLTMLPFSVLITAPVADDVDNSKVAWLGARQPVAALSSHPWRAWRRCARTPRPAKPTGPTSASAIRCSTAIPQSHRSVARARLRAGR